MKRIGLLGGMSWESTIEYYRLVNRRVRELRGGLTSADCLLRSVDFAPIEARLAAGRWDEIGAILAGEARELERAGAELLLLCTNTMHKVAPEIEAAIDIPFLHISEPTAAAIQAAGFSRVGLLATGYTMSDGFYAGRLRDVHGIDAFVPGPEERKRVHDIIFDELCVGVVDPRSREVYQRVIAGLVARGAQGIVLGCTEIALLVGPADSPVPLFDTTRLHAERAVELALG
jgi:aspartate racemase